MRFQNEIVMLGICSQYKEEMEIKGFLVYWQRKKDILMRICYYWEFINVVRYF